MPEIAELFQNAKEYKDPILGRVVGNFPEWLKGRFMRIGPGVFDWGDGFSVNYFLDGMAVICKIEIQDGQVTLTQRILESEAYKKAMICKKPVYAEFGTRAYPDTTKNIFSRMFSTLMPTDLTDNNVGSLYKIGNEIFAASETCLIHSIDPETLQKKERFNLMDLCGTMLNTAHPMTDDDGVTWNMGATVMSGLKYHLVKIPAPISGSGVNALHNAKIVATIPSMMTTCLTYNHGFTMTENYVIFMEQPYLINCIKMAQIGIRGQSIVDTLEWHPNIKNRFYVIEKATGTVLKTKYFTDESYFVFHFINAYECDDQIVMDIATYQSPKILEKMKLKKLRSDEFSCEDPAQPRRFVLPLIQATKNIPENQNLVTLDGTAASAIRKGDSIILTSEAFAEPGCELPTVNPRYIGKEYKYFYASGMYCEGFYQNSVCKIDVETAQTILWKADEENEFCGEAIFVPRSDNNEIPEEDDGCILSAISSGDPGKPDYLVILDGKSFTEIARVEFDGKFAQTLHGTFFPDHENENIK